jgi:hypothetical protein
MTLHLQNMHRALDDLTLSLHVGTVVCATSLTALMYCGSSRRNHAAKIEIKVKNDALIPSRCFRSDSVHRDDDFQHD